MSVKKVAFRAVIFGFVLVFGALFLFKFSPYQICIWYYEQEATEDGMKGEVADDFANRLCGAKFFWRD